MRNVAFFILLCHISHSIRTGLILPKPQQDLLTHLHQRHIDIMSHVSGLVFVTPVDHPRRNFDGENLLHDSNYSD